MTNYDIKDCHFSLIRSSSSTVLYIEGTSSENVSLQYSSFSSSSCLRQAVLKNVLCSYIKCDDFRNNTNDITWQFYKVINMIFLSDYKNSVRTSSSLQGTYNNFFSHSNISHTTASVIRTAFCIERAQNNILDYVLIKSCIGPPFISFHSTTYSASISHLIYSGGQSIRSLFVFEASSTTITVSNSIFEGVQTTSVLSKISNSGNCYVLFSGCSSSIEVVPNENENLSFDIKRYFVSLPCAINSRKQFIETKIIILLAIIGLN